MVTPEHVFESNHPFNPKQRIMVVSFFICIQSPRMSPSQPKYSEGFLPSSLVYLTLQPPVTNLFSFPLLEVVPQMFLAFTNGLLHVCIHRIWYCGTTTTSGDCDGLDRKLYHLYHSWLELRNRHAAQR